MENTINRRILTLMETLKMNANNFSKSLGKSYTAVDGIVKGKSKPGYEFLEAILAAYPKVSPAWLLTGEGEVFTPEPTVALASATDEYLKEHLQMLEQNFARLAAQLETKDHQLESKDKQIEGLQRTVDALISRPATSAAAGNFNEPVTHEAGIILPLHKETALLVA